MLSLYGIIFLSFGVTVHGSTCVTSHKHKLVKLGIFYSEKLYAKWFADHKDSGSDALIGELQKLSQEVSNLFSTNQFKECSAKFTVREINIHQFPDRYLDDVKSTNLFESARKFAPVAHLLRFIYDQDWDFAMLFVLDSEFPSQKQKGSVASLDSFCTKKNTGVILSNGKRTGSRFFGIYPKLLAHELGHGFGLHHDYECREEPCDLAGLTIMNSPGSASAGWSDYSRRTFNRNLGMKSAYSCLEWACSDSFLHTVVAANVRPREIFDSPKDLAVVNSICAMLFDDPKRPFRVSEKKNPSQFTTFIKYFSRKDISYYQVWKNNPQWFLLENICKGIPCERRISKTRYMYFGFHAKDMEGEPCSVGKVCRKGVCVPK